MADTTFAQLERLAQAWEDAAERLIGEPSEHGYGTVDEAFDAEIGETYAECAAALRKILNP